jgi:hypothetical protein
MIKILLASTTLHGGFAVSFLTELAVSPAARPVKYKIFVVFTTLIFLLNLFSVDIASLFLLFNGVRHVLSLASPDQCRDDPASTAILQLKYVLLFIFSINFS